MTKIESSRARRPSIVKRGTSSNKKDTPHHGRPELLKKQRSSRRRSSLLTETLSKMNITEEKEVRKVSVDEDTAAADAMLAQLSAEELVTAAKGSYEYIIKSNDIVDPTPFARIMANRYLKAKNGDVDLALDRMRRTLVFREAQNVPALMRAFDYGKNATAQDEDAQVSIKAAAKLEERLANKQFYVQGRDKEGRSTIAFIPRRTAAPDSEWTLKEALYSMERAIATSRASDGTINAVVDFTGFKITQHSPPPDIGKTFLTALRHHYAGQVHRIYILNIPRSFWCLWSIFKGFIGTDTKDKIVFVPSNRAKCQAAADAQYDSDELPYAWRDCLEALSKKSSKKTGRDGSDIDLDRYLWDLPFDSTYTSA